MDRYTELYLNLSLRGAVDPAVVTVIAALTAGVELPDLLLPPNRWLEVKTDG